VSPNRQIPEGGMANDTNFYSRASENVLDYSLQNPKSLTDQK